MGKDTESCLNFHHEQQVGEHEGGGIEELAVFCRGIMHTSLWPRPASAGAKQQKSI